MLHSLRFEPHGEPHAVRGKKLVIVRPVDPGCGVRLCATLLELAVEGSGAKILRLAEHQVLEEMREPGLSGALVSRTNVEPGVIRDDGRARVDQHEHYEPVVEPPAME